MNSMPFVAKPLLLASAGPVVVAAVGSGGGGGGCVCRIWTLCSTAMHMIHAYCCVSSIA